MHQGGACGEFLWKIDSLGAIVHKFAHIRTSKGLDNLNANRNSFFDFTKLAGKGLANLDVSHPECNVPNATSKLTLCS
jgi:hypothetical protein